MSHELMSTASNSPLQSMPKRKQSYRDEGVLLEGDGAGGAPVQHTGKEDQEGEQVHRSL